MATNEDTRLRVGDVIETDRIASTATDDITLLQLDTVTNAKIDEQECTETTDLLIDWFTNEREEEISLGRVRMLTEKSKEEKIKQLRGKQIAALTAASRKRTHITQLMCDQNNLGLVRNALFELHRLCQQFQNCFHEHLQELTSNQDRKSASARFTSKENDIFNYRKQVLLWITTCEQRLNDEVDPISEQGSKRSHASRTSRKSMNSNVTTSPVSARAKEKAKVVQSHTALDHPANMQTIIQKLPGNLQAKWRENVVKTRRTGNVAGFKEITVFVQHAADSANDPIYGKDQLNEAKLRLKAGSQYDSRKCTVSKYKSTTFATNFDVISKSPSSHGAGFSRQNITTRTCPLSSQSHDLDECERLRKTSLQERRSFLVEMALYFGCYGENHLSKKEGM